MTPQTTRPQSRQSIHRSNNFDRPSFENLVLSSSNPSIAAHNAAAAVANTTNSTNPSGQVDLLPQLQAGYPLSRQRHHLIRTARGRTGIIFGSRPLIPASSVPEELIEQVMKKYITKGFFLIIDFRFKLFFKENQEMLF